MSQSPSTIKIEIPCPTKLRADMLELAAYRGLTEDEAWILAAEQFYGSFMRDIQRRVYERIRATTQSA